MPITPEQLIGTTEEDAYAFLATMIGSHLAVSKIGQLSASSIEYDVYVPDVVAKFLSQLPTGAYSAPITLSEKQKESVYRAFYNAVWQMCLLGLLRPSAIYQPYNNKSPGDGYSITERGLNWFEQGDINSLVLSTNRIGQLLNEHGTKFGDGYIERSGQALLCHHGRAFLACCTMCGAAAESILLVTAIAKVGDEAIVMKKYKARDGRMAIEKIIFDGKKDSFKSKFKSGLELLKYWRDESSHGLATDIDDVEATVALDHLLRFAQLCKDNWSELLTS